MSIGASGRTVADLKNGIEAHIRQQMRNARTNGNTGHRVLRQTWRKQEQAQASVKTTVELPTTLWKQAKIRAIEDDA